MKASALLKNKFDLHSLTAFVSLQGNDFQVIKKNTVVMNYGLTSHVVADYYSKILTEKLDPPAMIVHSDIACPMILMLTTIMIRNYFRLLKRKLKKKKFQLFMIIKFSINSSDLQTKKKRTSL